MSPRYKVEIDEHRGVFGTPYVRARIPGRDIVLVRHTPAGWVYVAPCGDVGVAATCTNAVAAAFGLNPADLDVD